MKSTSFIKHTFVLENSDSVGRWQMQNDMVNENLKPLLFKDIIMLGLANLKSITYHIVYFIFHIFQLFPEVNLTVQSQYMNKLF